MGNLAISYQRAGRFDEALKLREEVLALSRKVLGLENPYTLVAMQNVADSCLDAGRRDEAIKLQEETLALSRKVLGLEHPHSLAEMQNLANSYHAAGRRDEALKLREEVLAPYRKTLPKDPNTFRAMQFLAQSYFEAGRRNEALKLWEDGLALRRKVLGPEHPDTLQAMNELAWTLATSDATEIRNGTNALNIAEQAVAATHRTNAGYLDTLAAAYAETHQFAEAAAVQQEAIGLLHADAERKDYDTRLKLYQANKPCRVPASP
jgi:tetratricopeptide (TPR) repeat protein